MLFFFPRIRLIFTRLFIRYIFSNRHVAMLWLASFWIFERQFIELVLNSGIKRKYAAYSINNLDKTSFVHVKGNFEPIVSEALWHECEHIRKCRKRNSSHT